MASIDLDVLADFCTLPDAEFAARQEQLRTTLVPKVLRSERTEEAHILEFDAALHADLEELVAFESRCCPGIGWSVVEAGDRARLVITGI